MSPIWKKAAVLAVILPLVVVAADTRYVTVAGLTEALDAHQIVELENRLFALDLKEQKTDNDEALINRYARQLQALIAKQY